jgi:hypothetical protein
MVLYLAADLLWASRVKATAESVGVAARPVRNLEMLRARLADSPVRGLLLDLDVAEMAMEMVRAMRGGVCGGGDSGPGLDGGLDPERRVTLVAFGPHVAVEAFRAIKAAGADAAPARAGGGLGIRWRSRATNRRLVVGAAQIRGAGYAPIETISNFLTPRGVLTRTMSPTRAFMRASPMGLLEVTSS